MHVPNAVFVNSDVSASFQGPLGDAFARISPDWRLTLLCLPPFAFCNFSSKFAALSSIVHFFFGSSLIPSSLCISLIGTVGGFKQCLKNKRRWMERPKESESEAKGLRFVWLFWVSLACGGAPLCLMNGWDKIRDN